MILLRAKRLDTITVDVIGPFDETVLMVMCIVTLHSWHRHAGFCQPHTLH